MPTIPDNLANWLGIAVFAMLCLATSTAIQEWVKKRLRNTDTFNRRKSDDPNWFEKFLETHDKLIKELHDFNSTLKEVVGIQMQMNDRIVEIKDRHSSQFKNVMDMLEELRNKVR